MITVAVTMIMEVKDKTDPLALAEELFDFLTSDPDDLFPAIECMVDYKVEP